MTPDTVPDAGWFPPAAAGPIDAAGTSGGDGPAALPFVTGFEAAGLERRFTVVVPARFIAAERDRRLAALPEGVGGSGSNGQRSGQSAADAAAAAALRRRIVAAITGAVVQEALDAAIRREIAQRGLRPAAAPRAELPPGLRPDGTPPSRAELPPDGGGADLRVRVAFEVLPEVPLPDLATIALTRLRAEPGEAQIAAALQALARRHAVLLDAPEGHRAGRGDVVLCDFAGRLLPPRDLVCETEAAAAKRRQPPAQWRPTPSVTVTAVGTGTDASGGSWTELRFRGAAAAEAPTFGDGSRIEAGPGQVWTQALRLVLVAGDLAGVALHPRLRAGDAKGRWVGDVRGPDIAPLLRERPDAAAAGQGVVFSGALTAPATRRVAASLAYSAPGPFDFTLRVAAPTLASGWEAAGAEERDLPGGSEEGVAIAIGDGGFVPGFAEQLEGIARGETRAVTVTFPPDHGIRELAGREARFTVVARAVRCPALPAVDDGLARRLGFADLAALRADRAGRLRAGYDAAAEARLRRDLLDRLAGLATFPLPESLVVEEIGRLRQGSPAGAATEGPAAASAAGDDPRPAATEHQLRLGLLIAEIARCHGIAVMAEELERAMRQAAARHPGREAEAMAFFRSNPDAAEALRGAALQEKVVDFVLGLVRLTERRVTPEALAAAVAGSPGPTTNGGAAAP